MGDDQGAMLSEVAGYYAGKLAQYGNTARGVDWNGDESQNQRFAQLCKIIDFSGRFSINDLGCGYGALYDRLALQKQAFSYLGIDISEDMIAAAREGHKETTGVRFIVSGEPDRVADFSIASGIFNVRLQRSDREWSAYIETTLDILDRKSTRGFAFNCLTSYSDQDKMRDYLYYADPLVLFDYCKTKFSPNVALLHDYGLYEFTILVRKT